MSINTKSIIPIAMEPIEISNALKNINLNGIKIEIKNIPKYIENTILFKDNNKSYKNAFFQFILLIKKDDSLELENRLLSIFVYPEGTYDQKLYNLKESHITSDGPRTILSMASDETSQLLLKSYTKLFGGFYIHNTTESNVNIFPLTEEISIEKRSYIVSRDFEKELMNVILKHTDQQISHECYENMIKITQNLIDEFNDGIQNKFSTPIL